MAATNNTSNVTCPTYDICYNLHSTWDFGLQFYVFGIEYPLFFSGMITPLICAIKPGACCRKKKSVPIGRLKLERKQYGAVFVFLVFFVLVEWLVANFVILPEVNLKTNIGRSRYYWLAGETLKWTAFIGFLPAVWSYIEGRQEQQLETKTRNKFLASVLVMLVAIEYALIVLAVVDLGPESPVYYSLIMIVVVIPFISVAFAVFIYFDTKTTIKKRHESVAQLEVELNQLQLEQEVKLQHVLNPLEQSQFLIDSNELHLTELIAQGGNGLVYQATLGENTTVAAKEIINATIDPEDIFDFEHEARMLTQLNHPHVLRVFGFCTKTAKESKDNLEHKYIVTEFAPNGSLEHVILAAEKISKIIDETKSRAVKMPFSKMQALEWAVQIASGTAFLHRKGFVHRDIKPQNVLLNKSNDALVADLGTVRRPPSGLYPDDDAKVTQRKTMSSEELEKHMQDWNEEEHKLYLETCQNDDKNRGSLQGMTFMRGTALFMAPEQFQSEDYSYPVDVWAYGVTLVRLFTLKWPYPIDRNGPLQPLVVGIARGELVPRVVQLHEVPHQEVKKVIHDCLQFEAQVRPTFSEIEKRLTAALQSCKRKNKAAKNIAKRKSYVRAKSARKGKPERGDNSQGGRSKRKSIVRGATAE